MQKTKRQTHHKIFHQWLQRHSLEFPFISQWFAVNESFLNGSPMPIDCSSVFFFSWMSLLVASIVCIFCTRFVQVAAFLFCADFNLVHDTILRHCSLLSMFKWCWQSEMNAVCFFFFSARSDAHKGCLPYVNETKEAHANAPASEEEKPAKIW